jgi:hypothetical protein
MIAPILAMALLAVQPTLPATLAAQSSAAGCAAMPRLALEPGFVDPRRIFGPESPGMRATRAEFEIAYQRACREGVLGRGRLLNGRPDVLYLRNAPDANGASIFPISVNGNRALNATVLEYPFVSREGTLEIPSRLELREAIYCRVVGATALEQEQEGRCLPD